MDTAESCRHHFISQYSVNMARRTNPIDLSVVVAAQQAGPTLSKTLGALTTQLADGSGEIIVVSSSGKESLSDLAKEFPSVQFLRLSAGTNVPKLWNAGIRGSQGEIVALTIEHCVPAPDWAEQVLRAHAAPWPAVGGAIEPGPNLSLVVCAIYFCRYSGYMLPFTAEFLDDLPGDNCSYKRTSLEDLHEQMGDGFWETFIHKAMRSRGDLLRLEPSIRMYYSGSISWSAFAKGRLAQARYFAARRGRTLSGAQRLLRAASFPAIPALMLGRIAARVWRKGRNRGKFLASLPLLLFFLIAWGGGESLGYLLGAPAERSRVEEEGKLWEHVG